MGDWQAGDEIDIDCLEGNWDGENGLFAPNSPALIVGRAVASLSSAGVRSGAYTIISFAAGPKKRAMLTGVM